MKKTLLTLIAILVVTATSAQKYVGGDISMLKKFQDEGAIYKDKNGTEVEPLAFFKQEGWNAMRVRLFVDPSKASAEHKKEGVIQDLDYVIALCKDIKAAGFKLMLDFHYSDTWTDPGKHSTPTAWSSLSVTDMGAMVYDYTKECLQQLVATNVTPDFIQTGNEITYGMIWPTAHVWPGGGGQDGGTWENFALYLSQAIKACKEVCPNAQIVIHTEMSKADNVTNFYQQLAKYSAVEYDIIGLSYYPDYHGTLATLGSTLTKLEAAYPDKKIMIVETGYGFEWQLSDKKFDYSSTWPISESGQQQFATDLIALLEKHPNVNGLFWWYPEYTLNNIVFKNGSEDWSKNFTNGYWNAALFHYKTGKALAALSELKNFAGDDTGIRGIEVERQLDNIWYSLDGRKLTGKPTQKGIYILHSKKYIIR